jgi:diaminopimelate decarboxylase
MDFFEYRNNALFAEALAVKDIVHHYGTPCYIYSRATLERHWHVFHQSLQDHPHKICYAVKANSNLAVLNCLARLGSGFDIVSSGELERVLVAGGQADKIVFSGVGKLAHEIKRALQVGIYCFNVESMPELSRINKIAAELGVIAPISLRVNPDVDPATHPYISTGLKENKFGIAIDDAMDAYQYAQKLSHIAIKGVDCHIGSQLTELKPFLDALDRILLLIDALALAGIKIEHLDLGGGLGVIYQSETPPLPSDYADALLERLGDRDLEIIFEPGRAISANAGILVTRVEYIKTAAHKNFAIVDAAMNDLLRPALYQAWQNIIPVTVHQQGHMVRYDVVGPVCETGDFLGKDRHLNIREGDLLAIRSAGAYGFVMSSNYNSRPRVAEVMVDKGQHYLIRERETVASLFANEFLLPDEKI